MSCQSLAARAFAEPDKDPHCASRATFHRTVRFSSDSRSQTRTSNETECKRETSGSMSLSALSVTPVSQTSAMSQSAPSASTAFDIDDTSPPPPPCRFPKLEECAHFHYERVSLGGLRVELVPCDSAADTPSEGWVCLKVRSHINDSDDSVESRTLSASWTEASDVREWTLTRNKDNFLHLDDMLHRCIYDRKVSGLPNLKEAMTPELLQDEDEYKQLISDYVHHLSIIADDSINCGPALNWLQMDNKGHKLLVSNEDSSSINTPAVAAAYSVRKYVSQARDEISFEVGDMISIIDMPGPQESTWWRGKRGFRVGFFPHHCVAVIGDKVPRHMKQPPPIVGSVAVAPIKPVLRKHGKLISLFRSFILSRPSRRSLKQQGILRERVFGCDLGEHLLNCGHDVPLVLVECARGIERRGAVDGIYRLSGGAALTQRLRAAFDAGATVDLTQPLQRDPHALASLLKMYFRELPNPLCTYQLYESFVRSVQAPEDMRLQAMRDTVVKLPPPHYRTLSYLMRHLRRVSLLSASTGMTARNMAIVWAPNLLRSPEPQHALQGVAVQAVVTEFLICYAEELFSQEQGADSGPSSLEQDCYDSHIELRCLETSKRPKSLPLNPPTKLLSLEEARRRGRCACASPVPTRVAPPALRPAGNVPPKYIEERFMTAQDRRRDLGKELASIEARLKELHSEMQNIMKGDDKYLQLCTEEHKLIIQERALRTLFSEAEREERELFATMSAAVKLGHERERAHAERNKYWYIVASILGTVLGIAGSTVNNRLKMAEFRDLMEQQMARSASVLYTIAGGGTASRADIHEAMKTEFAYQEQLANNLSLMQENINNLVSKQASLIDHLNHQDHVIETQMRELKRLIVAASQNSAKSDAELAKALSVVHQELDDDKDRVKEPSTVDGNQIITGLGILICAAVIFGNIFGRVS